MANLAFCVLKLLQWLVDSFDKVAKTRAWRREAHCSRTVPECCGGWKRARLNGTVSSQNRGHMSRSLDRMGCFARQLRYKRLTYDVSSRHGESSRDPTEARQSEVACAYDRVVDQIDMCYTCRWHKILSIEMVHVYHIIIVGVMAVLSVPMICLSEAHSSNAGQVYTYA